MGKSSSRKPKIKNKVEKAKLEKITQVLKKHSLIDQTQNTHSCQESVQTTSTECTKSKTQSIPSEAYLQPHVAKNKMKFKDCEFLLHYISQHTRRLGAKIRTEGADVCSAITPLQNLRINLEDMLLKADMTLEQHIMGVIELKIIDMELQNGLTKLKKIVGIENESELKSIVGIENELEVRIRKQKNLKNHKPNQTKESGITEENRKWKQCQFEESVTAVDSINDTLKCTIVAQDQQITKTESTSEDVHQKSSSEVDNTQNQYQNLLTPNEENCQRAQCQFDETTVLVDIFSDSLKCTPVSHEPQISMTEAISETVDQNSASEKDYSEKLKVLSNLSNTISQQTPDEENHKQMESQLNKTAPLNRRNFVAARRRRPMIIAETIIEDDHESSSCKMDDSKNQKPLPECSNAMNLRTPIEVKCKHEQFSDDIGEKFIKMSLDDAALKQQTSKGNNITEQSQRCAAIMREVLDELFGQSETALSPQKSEQATNTRQDEQLFNPNNINSNSEILIKTNSQLLEKLKELKENQRLLNEQLTQISLETNLQPPAVQPTVLSNLPSGEISTVTNIQKSSESTTGGDQQLPTGFKIADKEVQCEHLIKTDKQVSSETSSEEDNEKFRFNFPNCSQPLNYNTPVKQNPKESSCCC